MWPFRTSVKRSCISRVGLPMATVRVMSVVPSRYWPPESTRNSSPGLSLRLVACRDAIVDDGAVGAGAGDGVEADLLQRLRLRAHRLQLPGGADLVDAALRRLAIEPGEEAHHGGAVALVRGARALDLGGVLARLGQDARIGRAHDAGLAALELAEEPERRRRRDRAGRACRPSSAPPAAPRAPTGALILASGARCAFASAPILALSTNSSGLPLTGTMANASATGLCATSEPRMLNSQAIESGSVSTTASWPSLRSVACSSADLLLGRLAGIFQRVRHDGPLGGAGRALPHTRSTGLRASGFSLMPLSPTRLGQLLDGVGRMQPGIETDHGARRQLALQPLGQPGAPGSRRISNMPSVDLGGRLHRVAAIDEQRRRVARDHGETGRAGEARSATPAARRRARRIRPRARRRAAPARRRGRPWPSDRAAAPRARTGRRPPAGCRRSGTWRSS